MQRAPSLQWAAAARAIDLAMGERADDFARVSLGADYVARARRFAQSYAAQRGRQALALGAGRRAGGGDELVGHRPLRVGEDARDLDWELYARLERPFVRERRAEAGERWAIALDTSRSMGVGPPAKLQCAAEVAGALAVCGLRIGARVELLAFAAVADERVVFESCAREVDWMRCVRWLEARRAQGLVGMARLCAQQRVLAARRVFVVGDLFDCEPAQLLPLARRGRALCALAILAPAELTPPSSGDVLWSDPESDARLAVRLDGPLAERYRAALAARLARWSTTLARHGQSFHVASSAASFEDVVRAAL